MLRAKRSKRSSQFHRSEQRKATKKKSGQTRFPAEILEERILLASDLVRFDPTPDGDLSDSFNFSSLDFLPGSALVSGYDEMVTDNTETGDVLFQARLNSFITPSGNVPVADTAPYEITLVARFTVEMNSVTLGANTLSELTLAPVQSADAFGARLYYDATPDALEFAGTGFDDGDVIFDVSITALQSTSNLTVSIPTGAALDDFDGDSLAGVTTANVGGSIAVIGDPFNVNLGGMFLHDPVTSTPLVDTSFDRFEWNTSLNAPFDEQDPSTNFFGGDETAYDALAGIGLVNADGTVDGLAGNPDGDDVLAQADSNASFEYQLASIHGFKYEDITKNGQYDEGVDPPFPGITFELWNDVDNDGEITAADTLVDSQDTDATGQFWFDDLCSGYFIVREVLTDPDVMPSTADQISIVVEAGTAYVWQAGASTMGMVGSVTNRQIFYNDSSYDGNDSAVVPANDVNAIDPAKFPYLGVGTAGGASITTFSKGINGIRVDVDGAAGPLTPADFSFSFGDSQDTTSWTPVFADSVVSVMNGTVAETYISFPNGTAVDASLKVAVLANQNTRLPMDDLHYWSNKIGDTVGGDGDVGFIDVSAAVAAFGNASSGISDDLDADKNGSIGFLDVSAAVGSFGSSITLLDEAEIVECEKGTFGPNEEIIAELSFGNFVKGSIHGFKFNDYEADGVYDPNGWDLPFGGIGFELYMDNGNQTFDPADVNNIDGDTLVATQVSDELGRFWFEDLMPGNYFISELPSWDVVMPSTATVSGLITVLSGQELVWQTGESTIMGPLGQYQEEVFTENCPDDADDCGYDQQLVFGNYVKGSIHALKFEDYDGDGVYDPSAGDTPWNGFEFELVDDMGVVLGTTFSGDMDLNGDNQIDPLTESGLIWFNGLVPGDYTIRETGGFDIDGDGQVDSVPNIVAKSPTEVSVFVGSSEELVWAYGTSGLPSGAPQHEVLTPELTFANSVLGSIHGYKCEDINADGSCSTFIAGDTPDVVFVVDVSGSTNGIVTGATVGDVNGDGNANTTLDVELAGIIALTQQLVTDFGSDAQVAIVTFSDNATTLDLDPTAGTATFIAADADLDNNSVNDIEQLIASGSIVSGGLTNYFAGLSNASAALTSQGSAFVDGNVVFLSDGAPNGPGYAAIATTLQGQAANVRAFGVGNAPLGDLQVIDPAAMVFTDPSDLLGIFSGSGGGGGIGDPAFVGIPFSLQGADGNYYDEFGNIVDSSYYLQTNDDGEFWFVGLMPMQYTVIERVDLFSTLFPNDTIVPSSPIEYSLFVGSREEHVWRSGAAGLDANDPFELRVETEPDDGLIFANYVEGSIHPFKFHDVDQDGTYDPTVDEVFPGVVFDLFDDAGNSHRQIDTDFEGGTFPAGFTTSSVDPDGTPDPDDLWRVDSVGALDGTFSARSGDLNSDESSTLSFTVEGAGYIQFEWLVDSQSVFDEFSFNVDGGVAELTSSGSADGTFWYQLGDGTHTLEWTYAKDGSISSGLDAAFIDNVVFYTASDSAGNVWWNDLAPGDYTVVEYPDAFTNFDGEVMSTTHQEDGAFTDPVLGVGVTQIVNIISGEEKVGLDNQSMLPSPTLREEVQTDELRFGNYVKGSIHGFKFEDVNADGIYDPNHPDHPDTPWAGFEIQLWTDLDNPNTDGVNEAGDGVIDLLVDTQVDTSRDGNIDLDDSQFTNDNGEFWFTGLEPGQYVVLETEVYDSDGDGLTDEVNDEIKASTPLMQGVTVGSGEELVWRDGAAMLDPLTTPSVKHEVFVGESLMFGNYVEGSIHGFKYEDYNGNGVFDQSDDTGFGDIPFDLLYLGPDGNDTPTPVETQTSAYDGKFWFVDLTPGWYTVSEDLDSLTWADLSMPSNDPSRDFFVGSRQELVYKTGEAMIPQDSLKDEVLVGADLMYGNVVKGSIHGFKCEDLDGDSICETTAKVVMIVDATTSARRDESVGAISDFPGDVNLDGEFHTLLDAQLSAYLDLNATLAGYVDDNVHFDVTIIEMSDGGATVVGSGLTPGAEVAGYLTGIGFGTISIVDSNLDVALDLAIGDLAGWDPHLTNVYVMSDGIINVGDTGADLLDEAAAIHAASDNVFVMGVGNDGQPDDLLVIDPATVTYTSASDLETAITGNVTSTLFNLPEPPMAGVVFTLTGTLGNGDAFIPVSMTTDSDGEFWFEGLYPGLYTVTETVPDGMASSTGATWTQFIGSGEEYAWAEGEASLMPGLQTEEVDAGLIFGNYTPVSIDGFKFDDYNANGVFDVGEQGMGGIGFELWLGGSLVASDVSDAAGNFGWSGLVPGFYTVVEIDIPGDEILPTTATSVPVTLYSGESASVEFGNMILGSIHLLKFEDYNGDGVLDPAVDLAWTGTDPAGNPYTAFPFQITGDLDNDGLFDDFSWTGTTDADGEVNLTGLVPGWYKITELLGDPSVDPSLLPTTHPSGMYTIFVGSGAEVAYADGEANVDTHDLQHEEVNELLAFGNAFTGSLHGCVFRDHDENGLIDGADGVIGGVEVGLYDSAGAVLLQSLTTGPDGLYNFTGLAPGDYVARAINLDASWTITTNLGAVPALGDVAISIGSREEYVHQPNASGSSSPQIEVLVDDLLIGLDLNPGDPNQLVSPNTVLPIGASDAVALSVSPVPVGSYLGEANAPVRELRNNIGDLKYVRRLSEFTFANYAEDDDESTLAAASAFGAEELLGDDELMTLLAHELVRV